LKKNKYRKDSFKCEECDDSILAIRRLNWQKLINLINKEEKKNN